MPRYDRCTNPFKLVHKKSFKGSDVRRLSASLRQKFPWLGEEHMICSKCRKAANSEHFASDPETRIASKSDTFDVIDDDSDNFNIEEDSKASDNEHVSLAKSREAQLEKMLEDLKIKFSDNKTTLAERICILTVAPKSWSERQLAKEFNTSRKMAKKARKLASSQGVLSYPTLRPGRHLPDETVQMVRSFYEDDENSRLMPGTKDTVSVKVDGKKTILQKRLVLCNLKELHRLYTKKYPDHHIGFSKFAELRPPNCVLAGSSGTHNVCVCTYHQNFKLMVDAANLSKFTAGSQQPLQNYKDCIGNIVCVEPTESCFLDECKSCPGVNPLGTRITQLLDDAGVEDLEFRVWQSVDRSTLRTQKMGIHEFVEEFKQSLSALKFHHFIAKQQAAYISARKEGLQRGEVLVHMDFSENYAFVAQDAAQSFHFNNDQCTVHPVVYYYRDDQHRLKHKSIAILSDSLLHDTTAVYLAQRIIIEHMKSICFVETVIYVTDGAGQHYKNRYQFVNLMHHEEDFGLKAEWHFYATAHGKGACDGIGAVLKRGARRASLQITTGEPILTPQALYEWAKINLHEIEVFFIPKKERDTVKQMLKDRFSEAKTVPSTHKCHSFVPLSGEKKLIVKIFSNASSSFTFPPTKVKKISKSKK